MNSDMIRVQAIEIFDKVNGHLESMGVEKMLRKPSESSNDHFSQVDRDDVQEHLISSVIFRRVR